MLVLGNMERQGREQRVAAPQHGLHGHGPLGHPQLNLQQEEHSPLMFGSLEPPDSCLVSDSSRSSAPRLIDGLSEDEAMRMAKVELASEIPLTPDGTYLCKYCNTKLGNKGSYLIHLRRHAGMLNFKCKYCTKTFNGYMKLSRHMNTHFGDRSNVTPPPATAPVTTTSISKAEEESAVASITVQEDPEYIRKENEFEDEGESVQMIFSTGQIFSVRRNCGETIGNVITLLLNKSRNKFTSFDACITGSNKPLDLSKDCSILGAHEVRVAVNDSCDKESDFVIKNSTNAKEEETATGNMLVTMKSKTNLETPAIPLSSSPLRTRDNSLSLASPLGHTIVVSNSSPSPHSTSSPATDDCKTSEVMASAYGTDSNRTASRNTQGLFVAAGKSPTNSQQHQNVSSGSYDLNMSLGSNKTYMLVENSLGGPEDQSYMSLSGPVVTPLHSNNNTYHIGPDDAVVAEQSEENITVSADDTLPMPPRCSTPIPGVEDVTTTLDFTSIIFREHHSDGVSCSDPDPITPVSSARISNKNCPLTDFMISSWSEAGTLKKRIKGVSKKSKKIAKPTGKRKNFTKEQLSLATNILYSSRRVYLMLRNQGILNLPHIRTVHRHLQRFKCWPGINYEMFRLLTLFLSSLEPEDRVCGVLADEIKLAEALSWSARLKTLFKAHKV